MRLIKASLLLAPLVMLLAAPMAVADITQSGNDTIARAESRSNVPNGHKKISVSPHSHRGRQSSIGGDSKQRAAAKAAEAELQRQIEAYSKALDQWRTCMSNAVTAGNAGSCAEPGTPPFRATLPAMLGTAPGNTPGAVQVTLTPEQVAYIAFARLHLEPLKPIIGPPPELNRWKLAAVGYPLWLSGGGNAHPPAVSDQVFNLLVRLEARVTGVDFLMGDGHVIACDGAGTRWTAAVTPGQKSPTCGYQYAKPSLPDGNYTVTARTHWDVGWTINNQTGVIRMIQASSVELPVGELQVLVR